MMDAKEIVEALRGAECFDGFDCIFGKLGKNKRGCYGCFARYPDGNPNEPDQKCVAHQAADMIEELTKKNEKA